MVRALRPEVEGGGVAVGEGKGMVWSWNAACADQNESCDNEGAPANAFPAIPHRLLVKLP